MEPVLESVNATFNGAMPEVTEVENPAIGGGAGASTETPQLAVGPETPSTAPLNV